MGIERKPIKEYRNKIIYGSALKILRKLPSNSVHCCITSPPYWGLRDYNTKPLIWDGKKGCKHKWGNFQKGRVTGKGNRPSDNKNKRIGKEFDSKEVRSFCQKCGAWKGSLGLEPTPELYIKHLVKIFRQVKRVLRKDGTLWLNIGDTYSRGDRKNVPTQRGLASSKSDKDKYLFDSPSAMMSNHETIKPKDLVGIPWMLAFALRDDGWYLRIEIIWSKPNPMPESVKDRPTKSHEFIFLLSKSGKYFYDAEAIKEQTKDWGLRDRKKGSAFVDGTPGRSKQSGGKDCNFAERGRNKRSVWTVTTKPYKKAHFATFPTKLIKPIIKAGTSKYGVCKKCGTPYVRVLKVVDKVCNQFGERKNITKTISWKKVCDCKTKKFIPAIILDPFGGSGTVAKVSKKYGRDFISIDLNKNYCEMQEDRIDREHTRLFI